MASARRARGALRRYALTLPEAYEDFPWGEAVLKVRKKVFVFLGRDDGGCSLSVKLPQSHGAASLMPFATPTGYGLGRAGWVTATFGRGEDVPVAMLQAWIEESYRAVAPATLRRKRGGEAPPRRRPRRPT
ncbi:MAG: MmcQ/YjbR family DNA-binding protein [Alphaproteobacteria bacterium]|nr:MmcQ/YjbR family DNA-binding protein [Alphaproteobacteria bacterium]